MFGFGPKRVGRDVRMWHSTAAPAFRRHFRIWRLIGSDATVPILLSLTQTGPPPDDAERLRFVAIL